MNKLLKYLTLATLVATGCTERAPRNYDTPNNLESLEVLTHIPSADYGALVFKVIDKPTKRELLLKDSGYDGNLDEVIVIDSSYPTETYRINRENPEFNKWIPVYLYVRDKMFHGEN